MNYTDLSEVNKSLKRTPLKDKQYIEVNERIMGFRQLFPNGSIETNIESLVDGVVVMSCTVKDENEKVLAKAYAYEKENSTFINKTSFIENCCTSATGRALGYLGIGINTSVASYEEVANAIAQQDAEKSQKIANETVNDTKVKALLARCQRDGVDPEKIKGLYKVDDFSQLTEKQYRNINDFWNRIKES